MADETVSTRKTGHGVAFPPDALKRHYPVEDIMGAIANHVRQIRMRGRDGHPDFIMYIGKPHPQAREYLEIGVERVSPRGLYIFHAMRARDEFTRGL